MSKIDQVEALYLCISQNADLDFLDTDQPEIQHYSQAVEALSEKEMDEFLDRLKVHQDATFQRAFDDMIKLPIKS